MSGAKLTNKDWDLIRFGLKELYTDKGNELLNKIKDLGTDDQFEFKEELYLDTLYWNYVDLFPSPGMTQELYESF